MSENKAENGVLESSIPGTSTPMVEAAAEILRERVRQHAKWGEQNHPNGTGPDGRVVMDDIYLRRHGVSRADLAEWAKARTDRAARAGVVTYEHILTEEWAEAMAEDDPVRLRAELVQVAAVAAQWIELLDRSTSPAPLTPEEGDR